MARLILFNKPYQVLSQFTDLQGRQTLKDFIDRKEVYPAGRLDYDSEGLLLLTDSGELQHQISHPCQKQAKSYWVQVEGAEDKAAMAQLQKGVILKDGPAKPTQINVIDMPDIWQRQPPIRHRKTIPTHWLKITIEEGRNRQVRRMTAAVGLPTLRLIRYQIGPWCLDDLQPGNYREQPVYPAKNRTTALGKLPKKYRHRQ
ncbi:MAG: 23S rRNA pseudouridine2457 synthase [Cellvibrionaceae bacterium]|jgi:23S rRNA pseudouridine2457 synthase